VTHLLKPANSKEVYQMEIQEFLQIVHAKQLGFEYAKKLYLDRLAPDFTPFEFFDLDELRLSSILAWLLNPKGSHGQGGRFLELFLHRLSAEWPPGACEKAEVKTESWIDEGRIDIQIKSEGRCCIIENKPWAADQPDQLNRYSKHLDVLRGYNGTLKPSEYPLIYLTANGLPPTIGSLCKSEQENRIKSGQLHYWAFSADLLDWLIQCRSVCRADRVTVFIDELVRYIRSHFGGAQDVTMQDQLVGEIVTSSAMVASAMHVVLAGDAIRERLLSKLKTELAAASASENWVLDWKVSGYSRQTGFSIDVSQHSACVFRLEFDKGQYNSAAYGAYKKDNTTTDDGGVRAALFSAKLNSDNGSAEDNHWPWWRSLSPHDELLPFEANWGLSAQPWAAIADGKMAAAIVSVARKFRDALAIAAT
jgi:hypothetical protein